MFGPSCGPVPPLSQHGAKVKTIVGLLLMMLSAVAYGQVLKCVSQDGRIEFASVCPPGTTVRQTGIRNDPGALPDASQQKSLAEREAEFRKRRAEGQESAAKAEKDAVLAAQRNRACEDARAYLKSLQAGNRIVRTDPKTGERVYLEDAGYAKEISAAQSSVSANCN